MNVRTLSITVVILGLLCVAAWFLQRPAPPVSADARIGLPVLASDLAAQAAEVRLQDQGKTVTLRRGADGHWTVPTYFDFPSDFSKLTGLIANLTEAHLQRLVTARADRLSRLGFADSSITLLDASGKELWQVVLGKNADGGGRYLRYGKEQKGYLAPLNLWLDADAKNWVDSTLLNLKPETIAKVVIGFADAATPSLTVTREKPAAAWTTTAPAGRQLKPDRVNSLISSLGALRFTDTTTPDDAQVAIARAHSRSIELTTFEGRTYKITLGRKPEEKKPRAPAATAETAATPAPAAAAAADKPKEPEFETIPAGPVFIAIVDSAGDSKINALMSRRAFQVGEWTFTGLPAFDDLWETKPAPPPPAPAAKAPAGKIEATTPPIAAPASPR